MAVLYGRTIKRLNYKKKLTHLLFGVRFFNILSYLELRLDILVFRVGVSSKLRQVQSYINCGSIVVNGLHKKTYYLVHIGDIIKKMRSASYCIKRYTCKKWKKYQ
jgi:ribosomal protein S4